MKTHHKVRHRPDCDTTFVVGVDEWDFHFFQFAGQPRWFVFDGTTINSHQGGWIHEGVRPTDEQFNFARSFLSLTR